MAVYCNGKKGVCDTYPVCKRSCEYFDDSGGKHIADLCSKRITTNADRIRSMSDEELAELVGKYVYCGLCPLKHRCVAGECNKTVMEWLKQPVE